MSINAINIGLFSEDEKRTGHINQLLEDPRRRVVIFTFTDFTNKYINLDQFDILILDLTTGPTFNLNKIASLRLEKKITGLPILYIINEQQTDNLVRIQKDKPIGILLDPFTSFEIGSWISNLAALNDLQKRNEIHKDIVETEKKLIYQIDTILQLNSLTDVNSIDEFFYRLQQQVVHKIELTFAAERTLFLSFESEKENLIFTEYSGSANKIKKQKKFNIKKSQFKRVLEENRSQIIENEMLLDSFIQDVEELIGFEINSLLFVPITMLHQIRGVLIVINKLYRPSFTENDLALSLIIISKIVYHLETLYLRNLSSKELTSLVSPNLLIDEKNFENQLSKDILDSIGFGLLIFNHDYELRYANQFAKKTLKLKKMKNMVLHSVLGDEAFEIIDSLLKNRDIPLLRQEILVNHPGNRQLYLGYSLYNISENSDPQTYALTFMEISQTKRLQAEIIRMDRMASLGVLASGIAHEIRNPLAGIKAMAQTLQEELETSDSKNEYIERIVRQVNRLDELLKSFFSYARPQRPNPVRSKIPDIVREVLPLFRRKIKDNNIIVKEVYSRSLKEIFVDFHQIEQVFFNLIINAIDAMKDGGTLTIRARLPEETQPLIDRRQRIPKLFSDIYNEITISDTGIGMDSETLNNMYNPFFTTKPNGTGLGLSIVYQIILEHGGQITVDSDLDKGTTFKILLPVFINDNLE
jgi:signal transduction histidine kinase